MSIIFDLINDILSENKSIVSFVGKIMAYATPFIIMKDQLKACVYSFFPSYIERIVHFDTDYAKLRSVYVGKDHLYSLKNGDVDLINLPETGHYLFHVWNSNILKYEYYLLKSDLLRSALGTKNIANLWAFHDYGIIQLMSSYIRYKTLGTEKKIVGITVNNIDETRTLRPFMESFYVENNVSPFVLYMLIKFIKNERTLYIDAKNSSCTYHDEELNDVYINNANEYLFNNDAYSQENVEKENEEEDEIEEIFEQDDIEKDKNV